MSPNYPGDYNNSNDCVWVIRTFRGPITLNFTDFYTEDISDTVQVNSTLRLNARLDKKLSWYLILFKFIWISRHFFLILKLYGKFNVRE